VPEPDQTRIQAFEDPTAFWEWLALNHASEPEVWVKMYKKGSGQKTINWCLSPANRQETGNPAEAV
jgi:uncharacterized protein YdeI (YjbR/CyaY-like superfamily)